MYNGVICLRCTANLLHEIAHGLRGVDNLADARAHTQRALVLKRYILGEPDMSTLKSARLLVQVTKELSEFSSARMLCREVIETSRTGNGLNNYYTLYFTAKLTDLVRDSPDFEQDAATREQLLPDCEQRMSRIAASGDLTLLTVASKIHYDAGRYQEAAEYGLRAVDGYVKILGSVSHRPIRAIMHLANGYLRLHQYGEAEKYGRMCLESSTALYGPKGPEIVSCMTKLIQALRAQGEIAEAQNLATAALELTVQIFGKTSPTYLRRLGLYEHCFVEGERAPASSYSRLYVIHGPLQERGKKKV